MTLGTRIDFRSRIGLTVGAVALLMLITFPFLPPSVAGIVNLGFVILSTALGYRTWGLIATFFTLANTWAMDLLFWSVGFPPETYIVGGSVNLAIAIVFGTILDRKSRHMMMDGLTGALNHEHFHTLLTWEVERADRYGRELALLMIDLDNFKQINDEHGHQFGDRVLVRLVAILSECARNVDVVARYGGDEFAVVMPETGAAAARTVAVRIRDAIDAKELRHRDHTVRLSASIGGAVYLAGESKEELIGKADAAMYLAKRTDDNEVVIDEGAQQ